MKTILVPKEALHIETIVKRGSLVKADLIWVIVFNGIHLLRRNMVGVDLKVVAQALIVPELSDIDRAFIISCQVFPIAVLQG